MKLLIAGSSSITDIDISPYIPEDTDCIISGDEKASTGSPKNMRIK